LFEQRPAASVVLVESGTSNSHGRPCLHPLLASRIVGRHSSRRQAGWPSWKGHVLARAISARVIRLLSSRVNTHRARRVNFGKLSANIEPPDSWVTPEAPFSSVGPWPNEGLGM
jgi:hypothetical protein